MTSAPPRVADPRVAAPSAYADPDPTPHGSHYAVHIELAETAPGDDQIDALATELEVFDASAGVAGYGYLAVQLTVTATDWATAGEHALRAVVHAATAAGIRNTELVQIEILGSVDELTRRANLPPPALMPALLSKAEAAAVLGVSVSAMDRHARSGRWGATRVGNAWVFLELLVRQELARRRAAGGPAHRHHAG